MRRGLLLLALAGLVSLPAAPAAAAATPVLRTTDTPTTWTATDGTAGISIQKAPWRLSLLDATGASLVAEQDPTLPDMTTNAVPQADRNSDQMGHDSAYPGLSTVSTEPLAYARGGVWQHVTEFTSSSVSGSVVTITVATSDGGAGTVTLTFRGSAIDLAFVPTGATAVAESFTEDAAAHYFGGGERFAGPSLAGTDIPLWASHGGDSDRGLYTNEIVVPLLESTGGWGVYDDTNARGELDVGFAERPGVISYILEDTQLHLTLYTGGLQQQITSFTADIGRNPVPPTWAFTPMWWDDNMSTQAEVLANIKTLQDEGIPVGAYWIDNPFQDHQGDFAPSLSRFPTFDSFVAGLHAQDIKLLTWVSPYIDNGSTVQQLGGIPVTGTPVDNDEHTYVPARGLNVHLDLTDPTSYAAEVKAATALLARGVDGFKLDRSEEDLGDAAQFASGTPNALEHAQYILAYDKAMRAACQAAHPDADNPGGDCLLIARGGAGASSAYVGQWAGDTDALDGPAGLGSVVHSLISQAFSGQSISGSDIGGYGARQSGGVPSESGAGITTPPVMEDATDTPLAGTFTRWAQLGALSPVFESPNHPSYYDAQTIDAIRKAALLKNNLAPYTEKLAQQQAATGVPIIRPLALAFPTDAVAPTIDDEYLYGPCLLNAPLTTGTSTETPLTRNVYLPAGTWTNVFTGVATPGPITVPVASLYDQFPLFESAGCDVPALNSTAPNSTFADNYARKHDPELYFYGVTGLGTTPNPLCDASEVGLDHLLPDLTQESTTPSYSLIVPDLCNDAHDSTCKANSAGPDSASVATTSGVPQADLFLKAYVPQILSSAAFKDGGLLMITFDEGKESLSCCGEITSPNLPAGTDNGSTAYLSGTGTSTTTATGGGGQIGMVAISPYITPGTVSAVPYNHYAYVRTMEDAFRLTPDRTGIAGSDNLGHIGYAGSQGGSPANAPASMGADVFTNPDAAQPVADLPESRFAVLLPIAAILIGAGAYTKRRRRARA